MYGFCPLASGSKGNCILLGSKKTKILIDAGLSGRATLDKLAGVGVDISEIDAILISHEHSDHIKGVKVLAQKYQIPILANAETAKGIIHNLGGDFKFKIFSTGETFEFGDLEIHPFTVQHDTLDPVMFTVQVEGLKLGFCTDTGHVTSLIRNRLQGCDYLYVEANHEPSMVHACSRPMIYKQRVLGRSGHLSNEACADLLVSVAHADLKQVYLAHLSSECNTPEVAMTRIEEVLVREGISLNMTVAHQDQISTPTYFCEQAGIL